MRAHGKRLSHAAVLLILLGLGHLVAAQTAGEEPYLLEIVQRHDLRRRLDGAYTGLHYGYALGSWNLEALRADGSRGVSARYYLTEESIRDLAKSEKAVEREMRSSFVVFPDGKLGDVEGDPVPSYRGFPPGLPKGTTPGESWDTQASLLVDPRGRDVWTRLTLALRCTYAGLSSYQGQDALEIRAQYMIRYVAGQDPDGDPSLLKAEGKREAWIYLDALSGQPLFVRERLSSERYTYSDGSSVQNDGFVLTFYTRRNAASQREAKDEILDIITGKLEDEGTVRIVDDPRGIALSLDNLRFVADSPELLPGEQDKLDRIADALKQLPAGVRFLVVGHTADVGSVESQEALSLERARRVVSALKGHGLAAERFLYEGRGSSENQGDDATEEGRALNRRVEIIILD